jgi:drug/metabolite transporter (DMT)-like permease
MHQNGSARVGLLLALLSAAAFGTSGSFARALTDAGWTPGAEVAARVGIAAVALAVPAVLALRGRWSALRTGAGTIVLYGLVAVAGGQVFFFNAVRYLPVGIALLIEYLGTVLVVGWLWARHGMRPRRLTVAGSVAALAGLVLVLDLTSPGGVRWVGVLWGLGAAVGLAVYFLLSARTRDGLPPVTVAGGGMAVGSVLLLLLGAVGLLPMRATFGTVELAGQRASWLVPILGLSLLAAAFAYVAGIAAARRLGAKLATFAGLTEVIFAVLVAWALLGELPSGTQFAGGVLIVAGVALVRLDELRPPAASGPAPVAEPAAAG